MDDDVELDDGDGYSGAQVCVVPLYFWYVAGCRAVVLAACGTSQRYSGLHCKCTPQIPLACLASALINVSCAYCPLQGFSVGPFLQQALSALAGATDRLSDIVYDYAPDGISRPTVSPPSAHCLISRAIFRTFIMRGCFGPGLLLRVRGTKPCCVVRVQVTLAVRTGLVLVLIGFARSILGVRCCLQLPSFVGSSMQCVGSGKCCACMVLKQTSVWGRSSC